MPSSSSSRGSSTSSTGSFDLDAWQNGPITRFEQTSFAEYWDDLPELIVDDNDDGNNANNDNDNHNNKSTKTNKTNNKKNEIDPYNVYHRMAIGKYLIENTTGVDGDLWKTNRDDKHYKHHWYWTYLVQLDWLWKSGRLQQVQARGTRTTTTTATSSKNNASTKRRQRQQRQNNQNKTKLQQPDARTTAAAVASSSSDNDNNKSQQRPTTDIAPNSWWSYINLGFSICIYLGASKAGLVPSIQLFKKMNNSNNNKHTTNINNIESDPYLQKIINIWYKFFITEYKPIIISSKTHTHKINLNKNPSVLYPFYRKLWKYHIETIDIALIGSKPLIKFIPSKQEYQFGLGWCNMSDITSAMGWSHLSLIAIMKYGCGTLPSNVLPLLNDDDDDDDNDTRDYSLRRPKEYETCQNMIHLSTKTKLELYNISKFWLRVSHYKLIQYYLPTLLQNLNKGNFITKSATFLILLCFAAIPTSFIEFAFWGLILSLIVTLIYYITIT